ATDNVRPPGCGAGPGTAEGRVGSGITAPRTAVAGGHPAPGPPGQDPRFLSRMEEIPDEYTNRPAASPGLLRHPVRHRAAPGQLSGDAGLVPVRTALAR